MTWYISMVMTVHTEKKWEALQINSYEEVKYVSLYKETPPKKYYQP